MPSFVSSTSGSAILMILSMGSAAVAQLLGCDAVGCPMDNYRTPKCEVGNVTLKAIGIANVTTTLDSQPLTWTLGLQELNGTQPTFDRNFYLGTPTSLDLNGTTGCALFFEGVSGNLTTLAGNQLDKFTCTNTLSESCVSDLITQAESSSKDIEDTSDTSKFCNKLRDSLVNKPPSSCEGVKGSWGTLVAESLSGKFASPHIEQSQCHPTTGKDYDLSLIASFRNETSGRELSQLSPILNSITPVMTVFRKDNETGVELSCLKLVDEQANQTVDTTLAKGSASMTRTPAAMLSTVIAIAYFFVL